VSKGVQISKRKMQELITEAYTHNRVKIAHSASLTALCLDFMIASIIHLEGRFLMLVEHLTKEGVAKVTPAIWKKCVKQAECIEDQMWADDVSDFIN
jgi:sensor domain CHASE-containing protein